ncbi:MAG TPA: AbrB/MazE/SpoVT family DNA-binding domain-containing protein [Devosia sp.]
MNKHVPSSEPRTVSLFRNGRNQAVRIPVEFELPGDEATIRKEGDRLIIEAKADAKPKTWDELLADMETWEPLGPEDELPDIDEGLLPLRDIDL